MNWLEYSQCVLEKVRFDQTLFRKELRKFLRWLTPAERIVLLRWCRQNRWESFTSPVPI
jgi:hypothetical protein